jgi:23S rRNA pseudouridine2605 synthase
MHDRPTRRYGVRFGVARVLSKRGLCSRREGERLVREGRVRVNGRVVHDPEHPVDADRDRVELDAAPAATAERLYIALNKPRGLVTSTRDEQGRDTVYRCFDGSGLPWLAPVGRLDKASEGLLLFCNDPAWAAAVLDPDRGPPKTYHVQVDRHVGADELAAMRAGVRIEGEAAPLGFAAVQVLREGTRGCWLAVQLDEGRNRQIRRVLQTFDIGVLRLIRVAIGPLPLGELAKGAWRRLDAAEVAALAGRAGLGPPALSRR